MTRYSIALFAAQVVALMDHLELEQAVVMGTSLGANTALELAVQRAERLRGLVIEMPVLDNGLLASARRVHAAARRAHVRRAGDGAAGARRARGPPSAAASLRQRDARPRPPGSWSRRRVVQGLFFGRIAPPKSERSAIQAPTLVLGHPRDPVHPFSDAGMLAEELPNARLLEANSLIELRVHPQRLTRQIAAFLDEVWARRTRARRERVPARGQRRRA